MKVIACLDDRCGMMFNNRRQSRDRILIEDVIKDLGKEKIYISPYSQLLFEGTDAKIKVSDNPLEAAKGDGVCFIEDKHLSEYKSEIDILVIYRWNRHYPCDFYFDLDINEYKLVESRDFEGSSHEKITKEVYKR
ncbi:MAG: ribonuclease Z [Clostridia bacterium]|nr:ribonuclease Z [Clostridia bacterium]